MGLLEQLFRFPDFPSGREKFRQVDPGPDVAWRLDQNFLKLSTASSSSPAFLSTSPRPTRASTLPGF